MQKLWRNVWGHFQPGRGILLGICRFVDERIACLSEDEFELFAMLGLFSSTEVFKL